MAFLPARQRRASVARTGFLERREDGAEGVTNVILASWTRSRSAGVSPNALQALFHDNVDFDSRLVRCADPVIDRLRVDVRELPMVIALTDDRARILRRVDGSAEVGRKLDRVAFIPGFGYDEAGVGTNGVGTAIEAARPLSVVGAEHFSEPLQVFACTAAPIFDPITRRVIGVLDVSTLRDSWSPLLETLVRSAAVEIGRNLLEDRSRSQRALFEAYLSAEAQWHQAVMAVSDKVEMSNARAQAMLDPEEIRLIHQHLRFMMSENAEVSEVVSLGSDRYVRLRGHRVMAGADIAGVVARLDLRPAHGPAHQDSSRPRRPQGLAGLRSAQARDGSPAWVAVREEIRVALNRRERLIVAGEPGTGRSTMLVEIFHDLHSGAGSLIIDAAQLLSEDASAADMCAVWNGAPTILLLRDIDRLDSSGVARAAQFLRAAESAEQVLVAATAGPMGGEDTSILGQLLSHFDTAVTVPPLRFRPEDIPAIVTRTLSELAPEARVSLDSSAMRLLRGYSWPGNISELREAIAVGLSRRPVGHITAHDLPANCHRVPKRVLTRLETHERDAIVEALRECGGNRTEAADRLGISRSSLYRKLRTYSLEDV
jgi:transcriptional regulator of acetoin/glycerol metabolism